MRRRVALAACLLACAPVSAQRGPVQAAGFQLSAYSFESGQAGGFAMDGIMPGLVYTSRGVLVSASRATANGDLAGVESRLVLSDVSMRFRSDAPRLTRAVGRNWTVSAPLLLLSTYRLVEAEQGPVTIEVFDYTAVGIGTGLGVRGTSRRVQFEARLTPAIGFASRGFGGSTGRFTAVEGDLGVFVERLFDRFGLSAGYGWAIREWHVGGPDAIVASTAGKVNYRGWAHAVRIALAW